MDSPTGKGSLYYIDLGPNTKIYNMHNIEIPKALSEGIEGLKQGETLASKVQKTPLKDLPELEEKITEILTKDGYEGVKFMEEDRLNMVMFDNDSVVKNAKQMDVAVDAHRNLLKDSKIERMKKLNSPTSDRYYSDRVEKVIADTPAEIVVEVDVKKMVDGLEKRYNYGKETVEVKKIQSLKEDIDLKKKMISAAKDCVAKATT